ncbi:hypothetical protein Poly59_51090 [Rubripirellula reticaptiva]|uniref:Uncharacterized protein n=1 Tax=Rubripirellula reticaptiva TaxID=2528013 RepID=A0A5C6EES9_9BACT|nr:hypothetical protein Poly59_51090 [Rubripirellula reticaptiva]
MTVSPLLATKQWSNASPTGSVTRPNATLDAVRKLVNPENFKKKCVRLPRFHFAELVCRNRLQDAFAEHM